MRLIIIRHGDPDYERDSLTQKGWREAEPLAYTRKYEEGVFSGYGKGRYRSRVSVGNKEF